MKLKFPHKIMVFCFVILLLISFKSEAQNNYSFIDFKQILPDIGKPSTEKTRVNVNYDIENLYVTFRLTYKNPEQIFASVLERDQSLDADDFVELIIDSYNDKNNAVGFQTNYFGTRRDFELTNNGQNTNSSWNTFWDVTTEKTVNGWTAEFVIPFSSLRYEASEKNIMGFKFIRNTISSNERDVFPLKNSNLNGAELHLFNSEEIEFNNLQKKNSLFVTPYISGNLISKSELNSAGNAYETKSKFLQGKDFFSQSALDRVLSNIGFDLKYRFSNSTSLDFTLNTDFAQAEADDRIINLSRYSISLPEKRQFFLEDANFFRSSMFQHILFHSRKIGIENGQSIPIIGGIRLTGTSENIQYGVLNMQTKGISSSNIDAKNFTVVRISKYLAENNSYLGTILTNKESTQSSVYNRVVGIDGRYYFNKDFSVIFFGSKSFTSNVSNKNNNAFGIDFELSRYDGYIFQYRYRDYQDNFDTQMGFLSRPDSKRLTIEHGYNMIFDDNKIFSRMEIGIYNTRYWISSTNQPEYGQDNIYWVGRFRKGGFMYLYIPFIVRDHLYTDWKFSDNVNIPAGKHNYVIYELYYSSGYINNFSFVLNPVIGGFYGGTQFNFSSSMNIIFSQNLNIDLGFEYHYFNFPESYSLNSNYKEIVTSYSSRLNYSFSSKLSLKAFFQYDNLSKNIGSNVRLRFNPLEGTDLYIVYNQNTNTDRNRFSPPKPLIESQALVIKFSKALIF